MALLNTFDFVHRENNLGKFTDNPLAVRFTCDGVGRRRVGETLAYALAQRWAQKSYQWRGYSLDMAKQIANFYSNGNSQRVGYYRRYRRYRWDDVQGWTYTITHQTLNNVQPFKVGGNMYGVQIDVDEVDDFLVDVDNLPQDFGQWCSAFAMDYYGDEWAAYDASKTTPYLYEKFYDEPLTVVS